MKKKLISGIMALAIVCCGTSVAFATEKTNVDNSSKSSIENNVKVSIDSASHEQLNYAIEEMKIAIDLLDNADFTNIDNSNRMNIFGTTSLNRVRSLNIYNEEGWWSDHIEWIEESGNELRDAVYSINRLQHAIRNVETVFSDDRNDTIQNKINVIETLNQVINEERESYSLNKTTLNNSQKLVFRYASKIPSHHLN